LACSSTLAARPSQNAVKWPAAWNTVGELRRPRAPLAPTEVGSLSTPYWSRRWQLLHDRSRSRDRRLSKNSMRPRSVIASLAAGALASASDVRSGLNRRSRRGLTSPTVRAAAIVGVWPGAVVGATSDWATTAVGVGAGGG